MFCAKSPLAGSSIITLWEDSTKLKTLIEGFTACKQDLELTYAQFLSDSGQCMFELLFKL